MALASGLWFGSSVISTPLIGLWIEYANKAKLGKMMFLVPYSLDIILLLIILTVGIKLAKPLIKKTDSEDKNNAEKNQDKLRNEKRNIFSWFAILIIACCHGTMIIGIVTWINPMVQSKFGVNDFYGSITFAVFALALAIGRLTVAAGFINIKTRTMLTVSGIGGGVILAGAMFVPAYWATVLAVGAGGLAVSTTAPGLLALIPEQFPMTRVHVYGHTGVSICTAAFLTPWIIGALSDYGLGIDTALLISPLAAVVLGSTSLFWRLKENKPAEIAD
jgi:fucose permease